MRRRDWRLTLLGLQVARTLSLIPLSLLASPKSTTPCRIVRVTALLSEEQEQDEACALPIDPAELEKTRLILAAQTRNFDLSLSLIPVVTPTIAFASYEWAAKSTRAAIDFFGKRSTWFSDDGAYRPADTKGI